MSDSKFSFLTEEFVRRVLNCDSRLILSDISPIGTETGLAGVLAKFTVERENITQTMVVKSFSKLTIPTEDGTGKEVKQLLRESLFYNELSNCIFPKFILIPQYFGMDYCKEDNSERIVLEYIGNPWTLGNQITGITFEQALYTMKALARFHSYPIENHKNIPSWLIYPDQPGGQMNGLEGYLDYSIKKALPCLFESNFSENQKQMMEDNIKSIVPDIPLDDIIFTLKGLYKHWNNIILAQKEAPTRIIHMDVRGENLFYRPSEKNPEELDVLFLDWQNISLGPEAMDIAYLLSGSLTINDRRQYEDILLEEYLSEMKVFAKENNLNTSIPELCDLKRRYKISLLWPVVWACCTMSGIDDILIACGKTDPKSRARAKNFMITTSSRYIQAALDQNSIFELENTLNKINVVPV